MQDSAGDYTKRTQCAVCQSESLDSVLDLGKIPLPNDLPRVGDADKPRYPLDVVVCTFCSHVQLGHVVRPELMFKDYTYTPSTSRVLVEHFGELAATVIKELGLERGAAVVDIGSNDGLLLSSFKDAGMYVLGIDPAENIVTQANAKGIPTLVRLFDREVGEELSATADVALATNCLAHTPDPASYVAGVAKMLRRGGTFVGEVPYLWRLIDDLRFDTVYHEHYSYFGVTALKYLLNGAGLQLVDITVDPVHGGSLRFWARHSGISSLRVSALLDEEAHRRPYGAGPYVQFASRVRRLKTLIPDAIAALPAPRVGFGASAKCSILLNYCGIGPESLAAVVDASPLKQGRRVPGVKVPIVPESELSRAASVVNFVWNLSADLKRKLQFYDVGGVPVLELLPEPRVEEMAYG